MAGCAPHDTEQRKTTGFILMQICRGTVSDGSEISCTYVVHVN